MQEHNEEYNEDNNNTPIENSQSDNNSDNSSDNNGAVTGVIEGKDPKTGRFVAGNKLGGKPKGSEDFRTKWFRALEKIGSQDNLTAEEVEEQLLIIGYKKARDGDFSFWQNAFDRVYGKPVAKTELTGADGGAIEINTETKDKIEQALNEIL